MDWQRIKYWIFYPYTRWKEQREYNKKLKQRQEENKKRDPFIYK